jgi:hypothetical protein
MSLQGRLEPVNKSRSMTAFQCLSDDAPPSEGRRCPYCERYRARPRLLSCRYGDRHAERKLDGQAWLAKLIGRRNKNVAAVALANKNARIVWVLLAHDRQFRSDCAAA